MAGLNSSAIAGSLTADLKGNATLIWGAKAKPDGKQLTPVNANLQKRLSKALKWEHYYKIGQKDFSLAGNKAHRLPMSKHCTVVLQKLKGNEVKIELIGKGKVVMRKTHPLKNKHSLVVGGPDKDKSAWLVVLEFD